jgi:hypothetical protein
MSLQNRLQRVQRALNASVFQTEFVRFMNEGVWPSDPHTRNFVRSWTATHDAIDLSVPPLPWVGREVHRRHRERQTTIDRWMEEGTPYDKAALPSLYPNEDEAAALEAEVREWVEKYRADGTLPDDGELRTDVLETLRMEDAQRRQKEATSG